MTRQTASFASARSSRDRRPRAVRRPRRRSPRGPEASRLLGGAYAYRPHARQAYQPARSCSANVVWRPQCPHVRVWNAGRSLPCWTMRSVTARRPSNAGGFVVRSIFTSVHLVGRWNDSTRTEKASDGTPLAPPSWRTSALRPGSESLGSDAPGRRAPAGRGSEVRATYPTPGCPNAQWDNRALQRTRRGTTAPPCTARSRTASALQREMMQ
jgi:hypothetical protein